jgi:hypothetical protein
MASVITPQDIENDALGSSTAAQEDKGVVYTAIRDAQAAIESYLDRPLQPEKQTQRVTRHDWLRHRHDTENYWTAWADVQPIVEVRSPDEVSKDDPEHFRADYQQGYDIEYVAGWRRSDQSAGDFGLSLTEDPPRLPGDIRRVATQLTLFLLHEAEQGAGMGQTEQAVGSAGTVTISGPDSGFMQRKLSRLDSYKRGL